MGAGEDFLTTLQEAGLDPSERFIPDGRLRHFTPMSQVGDSDGLYQLDPDGFGSWCVLHWKGGHPGDTKWKSTDQRLAHDGTASVRLAKAKEAAVQQYFDKCRQDTQQLRAQRHGGALGRFLARTTEDRVAEHPFLVRHGLGTYGLVRSTDYGVLVIPVHSVEQHSGPPVTCVCIDAIGQEFPYGILPGSPPLFARLPVTLRYEVGLTGVVVVPTELEPQAQQIYVAVGWVEAATVLESVGTMTIYCFDAPALEPVGAMLRGRYANAKITFVTNCYGEPVEAVTAAKAVGGHVARPSLDDDPSQHATFNALMLDLGPNECARHLQKARQPE